MVSLKNANDVLLRISESGPNTCFELKSQKTKIDHDRLTFFAINFKVPTHIEWDGEKHPPPLHWVELSSLVGDTWNVAASLKIANAPEDLRLLNLNYINRVLTQR